LVTVGAELDGLAAAVGEADCAPSPDVRAGFAKAHRALDALAARWRAVAPPRSH
jgi:hypothetical protein